MSLHKLISSELGVPLNEENLSKWKNIAEVITQHYNLVRKKEKLNAGWVDHSVMISILSKQKASFRHSLQYLL